MACSCDVSLSNTGTPTCAPIQGVIKKLILVPLYKEDGTANYIDLSATLNAAYFTGKINQADKTQRWYPTPEIKNVTSEKADSVFEEFEDASKYFIRQGIRSFSGIMPKQTPQLLGQLENWRCAEFGVYIVDKDKNIIGSLKESGKLYPITVDNQSWNPVLMFGTDSTIQKIMLSFDFNIDEKDSDLQMITFDEITPVNPLSFEGLLDVNATYSNISTTGFKAALSTIFGTAKTKQPVSGLLIGDFALYNVTDSLAVTITSVTESPDGTYTFVIPAQTSADVLRLTPSKNGYDFVTSTITIP